MHTHSYENTANKTIWRCGSNLGKFESCETSHEVCIEAGATESYQACQNADNVKGTRMLSTMYGTFCLTAFSSFHDSKF